MPPKKTDKSGLPIKIAATAKLEVRKSIKKSIKETVPEDVTRAKAGAWLDVFKSLTQWTGLKGDEFEHKRRLQDSAGGILFKVGTEMLRRISK